MIKYSFEILNRLEYIVEFKVENEVISDTYIVKFIRVLYSKKNANKEFLGMIKNRKIMSHDKLFSAREVIVKILS